MDRNESDYDYGMRISSINEEDRAISDSDDHNAVKEIMFWNFEWDLEFAYSKTDHFIFSITFFISISIAMNQNLREKFYQNYSGKVPAVTQFLLYSFTLGFLNQNETWFSCNYKLHENCLNIISYNCIGGTIQNPLIDYSPEGEIDVALNYAKWFSLLENHCAKDSLFFNFVSLDKTPLFKKTNATSLVFFNQPILNYFIDPVIDNNANIKEKYSMLSEVLQTKLIYAKDYEIEKKRQEENFDNDESPFLHKNDLKEQELVKKLFNFIINCREKDLEFFKGQ